MTHSLDNILRKLRFPLIIWKLDDNDDYICSTTNGKIAIKIGDTILNYSNQIKYNTEFSQIIDGSLNKIVIAAQKSIIVLDKINDEIFLEAHYPKTSNVNLLYSVSNKIRTPLTNIVGVISMLEDMKLTEKQKKFLGIIKNSSYDIVNVVNDIIDIINLEKDEITLEPKKIVINEMLTDIAKILEDDLELKNNNLKFVIENVPQMVFLDRTRVEQIIINLLKNSINSTKNGTIEITMDSTTINTNTIKLMCKIKDSGLGMTDDMKNEIDKLLDLNHLEIGKSYNQPGFGLLICKYLVNIMGGKMWYKSELDIGTIFYFTIICKKRV